MLLHPGSGLVKTSNQHLSTPDFLRAALLALLFTPLMAQASTSDKGLRLLDGAVDPSLECPARIKPDCVPKRVGTSVVLCVQGDEIRQAYNSISSYCLGCHAGSRPMTFRHPTSIDYPVSRAEFREPGSLGTDIVLDHGKLTCKTCHSGMAAENHFLAGDHDSTQVCDHCHLTGIYCPGRRAGELSACFPGRLNGRTRCFTGQGVESHASVSGFCKDCHGNMADFHPVDVEYPANGHRLTALADLDPVIKLQDGRMTCESCHAARDRGMQLCLTCHLM